MKRIAATLVPCLLTVIAPCLYAAQCPNWKCDHSVSNLQITSTACGKHQYNISTDCYQKLYGDNTGTDATQAAHQIAWYDVRSMPWTLILLGGLRTLPDGGGGIPCGADCSSGYYELSGTHSTTTCPASSGMVVQASHLLFYGTHTNGTTSWSDEDVEYGGSVTCP